MRHLSGLVNTLKRLEFHRGSKVTGLAFFGKIYTFGGKKSRKGQEWPQK